MVTHFDFSAVKLEAFMQFFTLGLNLWGIHLIPSSRTVQVSVSSCLVFHNL